MESSSSWQEFAERFGSEAMDEWEYMNPPKLIPTGLQSLDSVLAGGFAPGVHVLMGCPGDGKSALGLNLALSCALRGGHALFVSVEMPRKQCVARCCAMVAGQSGSPFAFNEWERMGARLIANGRPSEQAMAEDPGISSLRTLGGMGEPLAVAGDGDALSVDGLCRIAKEGKAAGLEFVVVDYLQRLKPAAENKAKDRFAQISEASNALTSTAKELELPFLVISSMNREAMNSGSVSVTGGRGSGEIEFDAVTVMRLKDAGEEDEHGRELKQLHVKKNRRGRCTPDDEPIDLWFDGRSGTFTSADVWAF